MGSVWVCRSEFHVCMILGEQQNVRNGHVHLHGDNDPLKQLVDRKRREMEVLVTCFDQARAI